MVMVYQKNSLANEASVIRKKCHLTELSFKGSIRLVRILFISIEKIEKYTSLSVQKYTI